MKIALGCDHRGTSAARILADHLRGAGHEVDARAVCEAESCDYPDAAYAVGTAVQTGRADRGVLVCGSGIGVSMAANKVAGIRAALVHDEPAAEASRRHNDANVLCLAGDRQDPEVLCRIVDVWLTTPFEGGRHGRRVRKIDAIGQGLDPSNVDMNQTAM